MNKSFLWLAICLLQKSSLDVMDTEIENNLNLKKKRKKISDSKSQFNKVLNKPAAQAAGADPSRCNSTNRLNPPLQ